MFLSQPSPPVSDSIVVAQGLSSLKSIAAEVVASHDLLEENKSEDQDQVIRRELNTFANTMHCLHCSMVFLLLLQLLWTHL